MAETRHANQQAAQLIHIDEVFWVDWLSCDAVGAGARHLGVLQANRQRSLFLLMRPSGAHSRAVLDANLDPVLMAISYLKTKTSSLPCVTAIVPGACLWSI